MSIDSSALAAIRGLKLLPGGAASWKVLRLSTLVMSVNYMAVRPIIAFVGGSVSE